MMKFEYFEKFMNECTFLIDEVSLVGSGEPFLHPECLRFVKYLAKEKLKQVSCCSNGMMMTDFEEIVKSGLHTINVDIDGITQSQHEKYRVGSELNKILYNIEELVKAKKTLSSHFPGIYFDVIISKYNENDYENLIKLAKETKVNGIKFRVILDDIYKTEDWFPIQKKFKPIPKRNNNSDCTFKNNLFGILSWDGEIQLCCMSPNHSEPLIKLNAFKTDNLLGALDSERFYKLTKTAGKYPFCRNCSFTKYSFYSNSIELGSFLMDNLIRYKRHPAILFKNMLRKGRSLIKRV